MSIPSAAAIPTWVQITLGSGGIIGASALLFTLFKQVTDGKDATIQSLNARIESITRQNDREVSFIRSSHSTEVANLQRELDSKKEELAEMYNFRQLLEEAMADLTSGEVSSDTRSSIRKIESYLVSMKNDRKLLDSTKNVAKWVEYKAALWLDQSVESAVSKHPDILSSENRALFEEDIRMCLKWLQDSLHYGFCCRIEDYMKTPAIASLFPYRSAFQWIQRTQDVAELSATEVTYLRDYVDELARLVSS